MASPSFDAPAQGRLDSATRPQVLMIGGAAYTTRFVLDLARQIHGTGRFRLASLGLADEEAARSEIPPDLFTRQFPYPTRVARPRTLRQGAALLRLLVTAASRRAPTTERESADGARISRPLKHRIERRLDALRLRTETVPLIAGFDVYHHHSLEPERLALLSALPGAARTVLSVWGSDLLRTAGTSEYADQLAACARADLITVTSVELREVLLAKFGRQLAPKIRMALLGVALLDEIDACRGQRKAFLASVGLPDDCITVAIGNNASRSNQHVEVLRRLARLEPRCARRVAILLPLSYRPHPGYVAELRATAEEVGLRPVFLDRKLSDREIALLRRGTDVFIHVPISDAFSAAMLESVYAGSVLITGAWLPYSRLRGARIHFHELYQLDELPALLTRVVDGIDVERQKAVSNAARIREVVHPSRTVGAWAAIYAELSGQDVSRTAS